MTLVTVILGGGGGTRLWPLSTAESPKIFLRPSGGHSLLQEAFLRLGKIGGKVAGGSKMGASEMLVTTTELGWEDIGCWQSVGELKAADKNGNRTDPGATALDCNDCIIHGENVAASGVNDLIIAAANNRVPVAAQGRGR